MVELRKFRFHWKIKERESFQVIFKVNPIILGGEKKPKQITLLNYRFSLWAGFNLVQFLYACQG